MIKRIAAIASILSLGFLLLGCGPGGIGNSDYNDYGKFISSKLVDTGVGFFTPIAGGGFSSCGGVMIGPQKALTEKHCGISTASTYSRGPTMWPENGNVLVENNIADVQAPPDGVDLAVVILKTPDPGPFATIRNTKVVSGEKVWYERYSTFRRGDLGHGVVFDLSNVNGNLIDGWPAESTIRVTEENPPFVAGDCGSAVFVGSDLVGVVNGFHQQNFLARSYSIAIHLFNELNFINGVSTSPPCGEAGQVCCASSPVCSGNLICQGGICETAANNHCDSIGDTCCAGDTCQGGLECISGTCQSSTVCGLTNQACCATAPVCSLGLTCLGDICQTASNTNCDHPNDSCCAGDTCQGNLICWDGACRDAAYLCSSSATDYQGTPISSCMNNMLVSCLGTPSIQSCDCINAGTGFHDYCYGECGGDQQPCCFDGSFHVCSSGSCPADDICVNGSDPCSGTSHCINNIQDCGETGIDCGGACSACVNCGVAFDNCSTTPCCEDASGIPFECCQCSGCIDNTHRLCRSAESDCAFICANC